MNEHWGVRKKQGFGNETFDELAKEKENFPLTPKNSAENEDRTVTPPRQKVDSDLKSSISPEHYDKAWGDSTPPRFMLRTPKRASPNRKVQSGMVNNPYKLPSTPPRYGDSPQFQRPSPKRTPNFRMYSGSTPHSAYTPSQQIFSPNSYQQNTPLQSTQNISSVSSAMTPNAQYVQYSVQDVPPSLATNYFPLSPLSYEQDDNMQSHQAPMQYMVQYATPGTSPILSVLQPPSPFGGHLMVDMSGSALHYSQTSPSFSPVQYLPPLSPAQVSAIPGTPSSMIVSPHSISSPQYPHPSPNLQDSRIYTIVEFKRGRTVQFQSSFFSHPGEFVMCEGDNGEDLGMVYYTWVAPANSPPVVNNSLNSNRNSNGNDVDPVTGEPIYPKVIRHATQKEVQYLHNAQAQAELKCTESAKQKVREFGFKMAIVDSEYQFDRKKLTFYYDATERIDFRELVRDLYKMYRARIWMSKIRHHDSPNHHDDLNAKGTTSSNFSPDFPAY